MNILILVKDYKLLPQEFKKTSFCEGGTSYITGSAKEILPHNFEHPDREKIRNFIVADRNNVIPGVEAMWPADVAHAA